MKNLNHLILVLILGVTMLVSSCQSSQQRTNVSVSYYALDGITKEEVHEQITKRGPDVKGVGKALAATHLQMERVIQYSTTPKGCKVTQARVNVNANVILPLHQNKQLLSKDVAQFINTRELYARVHEEQHLKIADHYATWMEKEFEALSPQKDCKLMEAIVDKRFEELSKEHNREQLLFDERELQRIASINASD